MIATAIEYVAAVAVAGVWLRWAVRPVVIAFGLGRAVERIRIGAGLRWRTR